MNLEAPLGVLGGTFDPIHYGHLRLAEEVAELAGLTRVLLVPARIPNLRGTPGAPPEHRLAMARIAAEGNPLLEVTDLELRREGVSYTVDTLRALRAGPAAEAPLALILGADAFCRLHEWHRWRDLLELAHVVVARRPGHGIDDARLVPDLASELRARFVMDPARLGESPGGAIMTPETTLLEISATDIRARIAAGRSARYLLPPAVLDYIEAQHLYTRSG